MKVIRKMIRDHIPGLELHTWYALHDDLYSLFHVKLQEEFKELVTARAQAKRAAELADLSQLILDLTKHLGFSPEEIEEIRVAKFATHGGFERLTMADVPEYMLDSVTD